MRDMRVTRLLF